MSAAPAGGRVSPVLGVVGLSLAVLGTVFACIPAVFGIGVVLLLAGFILSVIGLFKNGAAKWPSIVGMILAVVGGVIGTIVLVVSLFASVAGPIDPVIPTDTSSTTSTEKPSDAPTTEASEARLSPEELAQRSADRLHADGITNFDNVPGYFPCVGQFLYDSELSDETLRLITAGEDPIESERDAAEQVLKDSIHTCDPNDEATY